MVGPVKFHSDICLGRTKLHLWCNSSCVVWLSCCICRNSLSAVVLRPQHLLILVCVTGLRLRDLSYLPVVMTFLGNCCAVFLPTKPFSRLIVINCGEKQLLTHAVMLFPCWQQVCKFGGTVDNRTLRLKWHFELEWMKGAFILSRIGLLVMAKD